MSTANPVPDRMTRLPRHRSSQSRRRRHRIHPELCRSVSGRLGHGSGHGLGTRRRNGVGDIRSSIRKGECQNAVMVTDARLPALWLGGAPATGKSTVAWQVFSDLADQGLCVGYLDIDQIGMLAPQSDADPRCHRFKVDNLAAMVSNYRTAGAQVIVISGVIDPAHGHDFAEAAVEADITFCHLTVDEPTLRERLAARGWPYEAADEAMVMMSALADAPFVTTVIDTTGREPGGLARDAAKLVTAASSKLDTQE